MSISIGITQQMPIIRCEVKKDFSYFNTFSLYLNIFNCYFPQNLLYYGVREIFYTFFFKNASQFLPFIRNFAIFALSRPKRMRHSFQMNTSALFLTPVTPYLYNMRPGSARRQLPAPASLPFGATARVCQKVYHKKSPRLRLILLHCRRRALQP